jgi:PAS domain-containing protein
LYNTFLLVFFYLPPVFEWIRNLLHYEGIVQNITDRKKAEEALRQSEEEVRLANIELEARVDRRTAELRQEKERSEQLLLNILPA